MKNKMKRWWANQKTSNMGRLVPATAVVYMINMMAVMIRPVIPGSVVKRLCLQRLATRRVIITYHGSSGSLPRANNPTVAKAFASAT